MQVAILARTCQVNFSASARVKFSMSISSSPGRRVAFSTQDFQQRIRKMLAESGIRALSAKPGLSEERLQSLAAEAGALPQKRQCASEPVRQAMGCLPQPVKSPASRAWQRAQPSRTGAARQTKSDLEPAHQSTGPAPDGQVRHEDAAC